MTKRPSRSTCAELLLVAVLLGAPAAWAQACCTGTNVLTPARLALHEEALVGVELKPSVPYGAADGLGRFATNARGAGGFDFTQTLLSTVRLGESAQLTWALPFTQSARWVPGLSEGGVGLGDVSVSARYDFLLAGESASKPGFALLGSLSTPTGLAPEQSLQVLGTDAQGKGAWQVSLGASVEQRFGPFLVMGLLYAQQELPRRVGTVSQVMGPGFSFAGSLAYAFESELAIAVTASTTAALPSWLDGVWRSDTARWKSSAGVAFSYPVVDGWRLTGSLNSSLPFGVNELTSVTVTLVVMRTWS